jgi:hypothetical protein
MNNCYVELVGGLGNQLFQIAAGYAYSRENNKKLKLAVKHWNAGQGSNPSFYKENIFKNFEFCHEPLEEYVTLREKRFNYDKLLSYEESVMMCGYFQSMKYFESYIDEFKDLLCLPDIKPIEYDVAIHIRRGDYMNHKDLHLVCNKDYYINSMKHFPGCKFSVFTDSVEVVKAEFFDADFDIIRTSSDLLDLTFMSMHDNIICSNSSFSWWASLLGKEKNKIIVPDRWFNNFENHQDIYRNDFIIQRL